MSRGWLLLLAGTLCAQPAADDLTAQLASVKRVYVDLLSGSQSAFKIRDLLITSLQASHAFVVTEDAARADAVLKGTGEDTVFTDLFQSSEGLSAHSQLSLPTNDVSTTRAGRNTGIGLTVGENDARKTEERKHEAIATVRLVSRSGDVIWSTTQESFGGKFLGAAADVADKVAKKLAADLRKAKQDSLTK